MSTRGQTTGSAVVIGAGIAGMCAARVLSKHYDRVTIVEADRLGPTPLTGRKGVPQSRHGHALLQGGELALEQLFPGFGRELLSRGALRLDGGLEFAFCRVGGWAPRFPSGVELFWCSRPLTEDAVRACFTRSRPSVEVLDGTRVTELCTDTRTGTPRVTGVRVRRADGGSAVLDARLVVDASGRGSQLLRWLERFDARPVETERVDAHVTYAGRWYRVPARSERPKDWWWNGLWIDPLGDDDPYFALLIPAEDNLWFCGYACYGSRAEPARDEESFTQVLRQRRTPLLAEAVSLATPLTDVLLTRSTANRWHHLERGATRVRGLLALGDAVCSFNPAYGQGMSAAAQAAVVLDACLTRHGPDAPMLESLFFSAQARLLQVPWALSTGADLQFKTTEGRRAPIAALAGLYITELIRSAYVTPSILERVLPVTYLTAPMQRWFEPSLILEVARYALLRRLAPQSVGRLLESIPGLTPA